MLCSTPSVLSNRYRMACSISTTTKKSFRPYPYAFGPGEVLSEGVEGC
jgi:hypothetical protein